MWVHMLMGVLVVVTAVYFYLKFVIYNYWARRGVPSPDVSLIFGNIGDSVFMKRNLGQIFTDIYRKYSHLPYVGTYKMRTPTLLICDPDLAKDVLIRNFDHFESNDVDSNQHDKLMAKNPFFQWGETWKSTRTILNPCYSSAKVKTMFPIMANITTNLVSYLQRETKVQPKNGIETKELCSKFTIDVVSECAFGLEGQSFTNPDFAFRKMGNAMFDQSLFRLLSVLILFVAPELSMFFHASFVPKSVGTYFHDIIDSTLTYRKKNNVIRNDFLAMMQDLKEKNKGIFDNEDIIAHAMGFFSEGFETSATIMHFMLYNLAKHPDEQEKLRQLINKALDNHKGEFTYDALQEMTYLENIFNETSRLYPIMFFLTRRCTKTFTFPPIADGKKPLIVKPGTPIYIPHYGYQLDARYFPDPEKFDPTRFDTENKQNIKKCTALPFGDGPKICMGQRFGFTQVKAGVASIIRNYRLTVNPKTVEPLKFSAKTFMTSVEGGIWLDYVALH